MRLVRHLAVTLTFISLPVAVLLSGLADDPQPKKPKSPVAPSEERKFFHLPPGLEANLVASEPAIESPVSMMFDEDNKLWVVEMRDYPNGPKPGEPAGGRIKVLEDANGDGVFEKSTLFADELLFANGLLRWRDGVIVTAAPHILFLRDTDGDGKADKKTVLFEGFAAQNPQLRVSHPKLGLDGWIYVANGLRGGKVIRPGDKPDKAIDLSGRDFRFDMTTGAYEAISGMGQFGNTFDSLGRRFVCDNRHHLRHVVLEDRYTKRNPKLGIRSTLEDSADGGSSPGGSKLYPLSDNWTTSNLHEGTFTAACGVHIYQGDLLPKAYHGSAFTCDPTANLVHQETLSPNGATFRSKPLRKGIEFFASPEDWCRPVSLADGPDGALYIVDMYRAVIEHPQFMPVELKHRPDLTLGRDRGRIWKVVPKTKSPRVVTPKLGSASIIELVDTLDHPNGWYRRTAQRLLQTSGSDKVTIALRRYLASDKPTTLGRIHASWLLDRRTKLSDEELLSLVRKLPVEHGALLAEDRITESPALQDWLVAQIDRSKSGRDRFQLILTMGELPLPKRFPALKKVALAFVDDSWNRIAIGSSLSKYSAAFLASLIHDGLIAGDAKRAENYLRQFGKLAGAEWKEADINGLLSEIARLKGKSARYWQLLTLDSIADGLGRRAGGVSTVVGFDYKDRTPETKKLRALLASIPDLARSSKTPERERHLAIRLLSQLTWKEAQPALVDLFDFEQPVETRLASLASITRYPSDEIGGLLLRHWGSETPRLKAAITDALLQRTDRTTKLLDAVEAGTVKPTDIDPLRMRRLLNHGNPKLRARARKLASSALPADRKEVLAKYQKALTLKGDAEKGRVVFKENCATCHQIGSLGVDVGPKISDTRTKTAAALLTDILQPNRAIDNNYISYLVTTSAGQSLQGIITAETASSITLKQAEDKTSVILRKDIDELASSGVSLMPDGLEKNVTIEQMADLLAFLKNWRYLDGSIPGVGGSK